MNSATTHFSECTRRNTTLHSSDIVSSHELADEWLVLLRHRDMSPGAPVVMVLMTTTTVSIVHLTCDLCRIGTNWQWLSAASLSLWFAAMIARCPCCFASAVPDARDQPHLNARIATRDTARTPLLSTPLADALFCRARLGKKELLVWYNGLVLEVFRIS